MDGASVTHLAAGPDFDERLAAFQSATFRELRPGQRLVLQAYSARHLTTPDLAIEMPTGEGKTLLALLIADYALDQGRSVAYLAGTRQLAERVEDEAAELGLEAVRFAARDYGGARLDDYHQAQAVGVMNYWVYFNSRPVPQPADLVIFDDAHLAEQPLSGLQTLRILTGSVLAASCTGRSVTWSSRTPMPTPGCRRCATASPVSTSRLSCCPSATGPRSPRPRVTRSTRRRW